MLSSVPASLRALRSPAITSSHMPNIFQKRCPCNVTGRLRKRCTSSRLNCCPSKRASMTRPLSAPRSTAATLRVAIALSLLSSLYPDPSRGGSGDVRGGGACTALGRGRARSGVIRPVPTLPQALSPTHVGDSWASSPTFLRRPCPYNDSEPLAEVPRDHSRGGDPRGRPGGVRTRLPAF